MSADLITLQALLLTLPQLDVSLSEDLQRSVHKIGQDLATHQPAIADEIDHLVTQNDCLKTVYQQTYEHLQTEKQATEQTRQALFIQPTPIKQPAPPANQSWEAIAITVLTDPNPVAASRLMIRRVVTTWRRSTVDTNVLPLLDHVGNTLAFLSRVAQQIEAQDIAVLRALRSNPRTVEDLSYSLGMPLDKVEAIVASLWAIGEIDHVSSRLWHRLLPMLKPQPDRHYPIDLHDYFTLTIKGHFRLRPLFSVRSREGMPG